MTSWYLSERFCHFVEYTIVARKTRVAVIEAWALFIVKSSQVSEGSRAEAQECKKMQIFSQLIGLS